MRKSALVLLSMLITCTPLRAQLTAPQQQQVCTDLGKIKANTRTETAALKDARTLACPAVPPGPVTPPPPPPPPVVNPPSPPPEPDPGPVTPPPVITGGLIQAANLKFIGSFKLPSGKLGSTWGFGSNAGCCGLGTYGVTFNGTRGGSFFIGGHPYEQRIAEIAIPSALGGTAGALSNLLDPLEGKIGSINPGDPNTKIIGGTLVIGDRLLVAAYSYYDGAATQKLSWFSRSVDLTKPGVVGPVQVGSQYPGWVDRSATLLPAEWGLGPVGFGGGGGAINSVQSWGPALSTGDPADISNGLNIPATLVLGYPIAHPLANTAVGNALWSQADVVAGVAAIPGTRSVLFFGIHGMGEYCYGGGTPDASLHQKLMPDGVDHYCYDRDFGSKGTHAYPYRSQVWAYDAADLQAVKAGTKAAYDVKPYATWELDGSFKTIQGVAYDPASKRLFVSQVGGDSTNSGQPLIRVYQLQ